uniref:At1g61320/AtMIF1 LRR domain-containing protein n=1 Tax=Solanum tuberosum TaxID=4113 RepID=M1A402_SOLTU
MKFPNGLDHENFCSDFPRLETLLMGPCEAKKTVKISSSSLRTLFLFFTRMHEDSRTRVVFAPNLSTYECVGTTFKPFLNPSDAPNLLETKIGLAYHVKKIHKPLTFINLRDRLKDFSNNIGLSLCIRDDDDNDESVQSDQWGADTATSGIYETVRSEVRRAISDIQSDLEDSTCLSVLHLSCCTLGEYVLNGEAKFSSLQELKLDGVRFYGESLSRFISKYPCIRELRLVNCERQWRSYNKPEMFIVLSNLDNLEKLYVKHYDYMKSIQVIAPNLKVFHFVYPSDCNNNAVYMDIRACTMLQEFHLDCGRFPVGLNEDLCSDFPHLETLYFGCQTRKYTKISSQSLRTLTLSFTKRLEISTPNLSSFKYIGTQYIPCLAPSDSSKLVETRIELLIKAPTINNVWFKKLIIHLNNFSNNMVLSLCIWDEVRTYFNFNEYLAIRL